MKMKVNWLLAALIILLAALLVACGADTENGEPAAQPDEPVTALEPADDAASAPETEEGSATDPAAAPEEDMSMDEPGTPAADPPQAGEATVGEPVAPVVVDLSELTPEPADSAGDGENIVQPAPGQPGPPADLLEQITADLERRLDTDRTAAAITLESSEIVNWPDAGLGCPDPDMMYAAVLTPGYELVFTANGEQYTYHTDMSATYVLCVDGRPAG